MKIVVVFKGVVSDRNSSSFQVATSPLSIFVRDFYNPGKYFLLIWGMVLIVKHGHYLCYMWRYMEALPVALLVTRCGSFATIFRDG
ncbi:hypothetical protein D3C84_689700 [compost metagenome]